MRHPSSVLSPAGPLLVLAAALTAHPLRAQREAPAPLRHHPLQLDCAHYHQAIESEVVTEVGNRRLQERTGRDGVLVVGATPGDSSIAIEAWFNALLVWREGVGERIEPETDGVIGGRFRGRLTPAGSYREEERPFVPDEVAAVADVGGTLQDFFPPLPEPRLGVGESWSDSLRWTFRRLPDAGVGGRPVERYRLDGLQDHTVPVLLPDSTVIDAVRSETETGTLYWDPELGMTAWAREVQVQADLVLGGRKPAWRTRIRQRNTVTRLAGEAGCSVGH